MNVKVRRIKNDGELDRAGEIVREEIYDILSFEQMKSWMYRGIGSFPYCQHFVAEGKDGEILGFVSWGVYDRSDPDLVLEINWLAVSYEYQRQGIGRRLVEESLAEVKSYWNQEGLRVRAVMVSTDSTSAGFYRKVLAPAQERRFIKIWSDGGSMIVFCRVFES